MFWKSVVVRHPIFFMPIKTRNSKLFVTFAVMKQKLDWRLIILFLLICAGLYIITESFLMSLGILLLLFVADHFVQELQERKRNQNKND